MEDDGETLVEPAATGVAAPTPWSMLAVSALAVVHESVECPPVLTDAGLAESVQVGAFGDGGGGGGGGGGGAQLGSVPTYL